jgi:hypothetical protein
MAKALGETKPAAGGMASAFSGAADAVRVGKEVIGAAIDGVKNAFKSLASGDVAGALSSLVDGLAGVAKSLDLLVPGLGEVAAAAVQAAGGIASLTLGGAALAISANEAKAKWTSLFDALGGGQTTGAETLGMLDELGDKIGQTREQLAPLARGFMTMGITGKEQLEGLTTAAAAANAMVAGGADAFTKLYGQINAAAATGSKLTIPYKKLDTQLREMGLNVGDLAGQMGMSTDKLQAGLKAGTISASALGTALTDAASSKGAGPLQRAANSLTSVWAKFKENIDKIFESIDVGPFLEQVKSLFDIFGQGPASGQALKAGIGGFFKQVFETATKVVPMVKHFLLDLVIWGLKGYIALKPIVTWFQDLRKNQTVMAIMTQAFEGLKIAVEVVAGVIAAVVVLFLGLAAVGTAVGASLWALAGIVIGFVTDTIVKLGEWVTEAENAGTDFVKGLIDGITSGAAGVVDAVTGLAGKAKDAFTDFLGIKSPSKVMFEAGDVGVAGGVAAGVQAGTPDVAAASADMAKAAAAPVQAAAPKVNAPGLSAGVSDAGGAKAPALAPSVPSAAPAVNAPSLSAKTADLAPPPALKAPAPEQVSGGGAPAIDLSKAFAGPPQAPPQQAAPAPAAGGGGGNTFHFDIQINGADKSLQDISAEALSDAFEQAAQRAGVS